MSNVPDTGPAGNGPWRLLLLDKSDPDDPRWCIASVVMPSDVRPAELGAYGNYTGWLSVTRWVRQQVGPNVALTPIPDLLAWAIDETGQPR